MIAVYALVCLKVKLSIPAAIPAGYPIAARLHRRGFLNPRKSSMPIRTSKLSSFEFGVDVSAFGVNRLLEDKPRIRERTIFDEYGV